jgi:hypothetical protein
MLRDITFDQFRHFLDGGYQFSVQCPDGTIQQVRLYLSGGRRKFRLAQFDLWFSDFNLCSTAGERFCEEIRPAIDAAGSIPRGTIVMLPSGDGSTLTFSIPRGQEGVWLMRAAEYLLDAQNLYSIVPDLRKAS